MPWFIIPPTQDQELQNIENHMFATPIESSSRSSSVDNPSQTLSKKEKLLKKLYTDDSDEEVTDLRQLDEKIDSELQFYKSTKLSHDKKLKTDILQWWKDHKSQFPCLFLAAKAFLSTPATSVPSEHIFSEAGYIARVRYSEILV